VLRQIRKTTKKPPLYVAKKYVETYSSSNAAAQDPKERARLINIQQITLQDKFSHTKITKDKEKRANATTDGPKMT